MSSNLSWGILGAGRIARKFAIGLSASETGKLVAIGSRTGESAERFAAEFPCTPHASYADLLADPAVEAVYIATPHALHEEWAIKAAEAGKHLLCEKPLTMNLSQARAVIKAARKHDVFLMEAFMYRCHPQTDKLVELIRNKAIGEVRLIQATFSFLSQNAPENWRLLDRAIGGGGILDVGGYTTSMARLVAGAALGRPFAEPLEIKGSAEIGSASEVDEYAVGSMKFEGGILAQLACGVHLNLENIVKIWGTEGTLVVPSPWTGPTPGTGFSKIILFKDGVAEEVVVDCDRDLFGIEADNVAAHIARRQSPAMSWEDTLGNMQALDAWQASCRGN